MNVNSVIIRYNTVRENIAVSDHGGGLYIEAPAAEITRNLISENGVERELGDGWGGGADVFGGGTSATLTYDGAGRIAHSAGRRARSG